MSGGTLFGGDIIHYDTVTKYLSVEHIVIIHCPCKVMVSCNYSRVNAGRETPSRQRLEHSHLPTGIGSCMYSLFLVCRLQQSYCIMTDVVFRKRVAISSFHRPPSSSLAGVPMAVTVPLRPSSHSRAAIKPPHFHYLLLVFRYQHTD